MRQRDRQNNLSDDEDGGFAEGLFGGVLQMPLPVPEILSNLDKTTFESK